MVGWDRSNCTFVVFGRNQTIGTARVSKMVDAQYRRLAEWQNGGTAERQNGGMAEWRNGRMAEWQNETWQNGYRFVPSLQNCDTQACSERQQPEAVSLEGYKISPF